MDRSSNWNLQRVAMMLVVLLGVSAFIRNALASSNGNCVGKLYTLPNGALGFYCGGPCAMPAGCFMAGNPGANEPEGTTGEYDCLCAYPFAVNCGRKVTWRIQGGVARVTDGGCVGPCATGACCASNPVNDPLPPFGIIDGCECK